MSGILDHSEGPVTQSMKDEFEELLEHSEEADKNFEAEIEKEMKKFNSMSQ